MYSSQIYLYDQKYTVVLRDTSNATIHGVRYRTVYAKKLKLHKGTDNVLLFEFVNQDQKPVNITGLTLTFNLINQNGTGQLLTKDFIHVTPLKGKSKVTITEGELDDIGAQRANYSIIKAPSDDGSSDRLFESVLVDDDLGGRGTVEIQDSTFPTHQESTSVSIPTFNREESGSTTHFSSEFDGSDNGSMTLQYVPTSFSGFLQLQGTAGDGGLFYDIGDTISLSASSTTGFIHFTGFHPKIRLKIENESGTIDSIKVR
tara:strand:- start:297 stop:1073 length:777 start_codon:yes stop_codon:yes gene_type:complete